MLRLLLLLTLTIPLSAGEFNPTLKIGEAAPAWKDLEGVDGKKHALDDLKGKDAIVVAFICNSCATVTAYEERINTFVGNHCGKDAKAVFVAINVNTIKEDLLPKMKERAEKKKYPFTYLYDPSQQIARLYGARYTPEFFVINKERKIVYMGAMDDKSNAINVKNHYLTPALESVLTGRVLEKSETAAFGCRIRFLPMTEK